MFKHLDADNDGFITVSEIVEGMKGCESDISLYLGRDPDWQRILKSLDTDGDGKLDYHEFIQSATNRVSMLSEENLKKAFDMLDTDGNGKVSEEELRETFASGCIGVSTSKSGWSVIDDSLFKQMIEHADLDGDGEINFEEFRKSMAEMLSKEEIIRESQFRQ